MAKAQRGVYERGKRGGRKDGQWVAVANLGWRDGKWDRREFTGPTAAAATEKRDEFLHRRRDGFTLPKGRQPYVSEWVTHWLWNIAKPKIDANTFYRSYRQKCEDYIIPHFAKIKLAELDVEDVEAWHQELLARESRLGGTLSPSTVTTAHRILSRSLNVAVARKRMGYNPCTLAPPPEADRPEPEPPSTEEVQLVLDACRDRAGGARWILAICTGLRQGEALGLRWGSVKLGAPASVTVRRSLARIDGEFVDKDPKSKKSKRTVPLPRVAVEALTAHRDAQAVGHLREARVFTDPAGQPVNSRKDWQEWTDLLEELGLPHYRVHDLRHGYATMLLEEGEDPRVVQDLMGHSDARMLEIYQHVRPVMHQRAVARLDRRFGGD